MDFESHHPRKLPECLGRTEEAGGLQAIGISGQIGKAFEDAAKRLPDPPADCARERVMRVTFRCIAVAFGDGHTSPAQQSCHQVPSRRHRDGLVGPTARRHEVTFRQRNFDGVEGTLHDGHLGLGHSNVLRGPLARVTCSADVARGKGRHRRRRVAHSLEDLIHARRRLECLVGRGARRVDVTLVCQ